MSVRDATRFLCEFIRRPTAVGAVAPSSVHLANRMVEWVDWPRVNVAVEYGPGTGAFTGAIRSRMGAAARLIAIEVNPHFASSLASRYPSVEVCQDDVRNVAAICHQRGVAEIDAVLCGLPWAAFSPSLQDECLGAMMAVLRPGGQFATFAYLQGLLLPAAQRFRRKLNGYFSAVETSPVVWRNLPPAVVYRCRR